MWSCSKEEPAAPKAKTVKVDLSASVGLGRSSSDPALTGVDRSLYDLRFVVEIYDESDTRVKRSIQTVTGSAQTALFSFDLFSAKYKVLYWADLVPAKATPSKDDYMYNTSSASGLKNISINPTWSQKINADEKGAWYANSELDMTGGEVVIPSVTLSSPLTKYRVFSKNTDDTDGLTGLTVALNAFGSFNAMTGKAATETTFNYNGARPDAGTEAAAGLIFYDYFLPLETSSTLDVELGNYGFTTEITVGPNNLLTVKAPFTEIIN